MRLYFCAGCGVLISKTKPEELSDTECVNCGTSFRKQLSIVGEFTEAEAERLIKAYE